MKKQSTKKSTLVNFEHNHIEPIVKKWMLEILLFLGGNKCFIREDDFSVDIIANKLGLEQWIDVKKECFDKLAIKNMLQEQYSKVESLDVLSIENKVLRGNLNQLANLVGLNQTEKKLILFAVFFVNSTELQDTASFLGKLSSNSVCQTLSMLLNEPFIAVKAAFNQKSKLYQSGLLVIDRGGQNRLDSKIGLISRNFADVISSDVTEPINLIKEMVFKSKPAQLSLDNYPYLKQEISILLPYFRKVKTTKRKGVNVFIYGAPGTGKTQFVRAFAQSLGICLYEVSSEDDDGEMLKGCSRLRGLSAGQNFLSQQNSMILFDEIEDVFNDGGLFEKSTASKNKAWLNNFLEENEIPTFWLSNTINGVDPAVIRRFDLVFEMPIPPKAQRKNIISKICGEHIDENLQSELASSDCLAPAIIAKASSIIDCIKDDMEESAISDSFSYIINKTLYAQGHKKLSHSTNILPSIYDPEFIQADCNLLEITQGLTDHKSGRLCLYGPPGTGKTAYGYWLAEKMDKQIVVKKASDLISAYVGGSEKNIALAFEQAKDEESLLMLDEVDTFLQDRRMAQRSWEVSQVNEMLTQMESFDGIFIASTNLMDSLDQASLRRFDLKIKFGYLNHAQSKNLLVKYCEQLGITYDKNTIELPHLKNLTLGDFNVIARQHKFKKFNDLNSVVAALKIESEMKGDKQTNPIGFI